MLALVERNLHAIQNARTDQDLAAVLSSIGNALGFQSGFLIEYSADLLRPVHVVDSQPGRLGWWQEFLSSDTDRTTQSVVDALSAGGTLHMDASRFRSAKMLALAKRMDMLQWTVVPVTYESMPVGVAGFTGEASLSAQQQTALQLLVYSLFAQMRQLHNVGITIGHEALTPREKEVIALSADGLTSQDIADQLGVAPRTVNQHVDNVARKLGTNNRAHTVAEAIRRGLI